MSRFTESQREALDRWARTQPELRAVFPYTNLSGPDRQGLGEILQDTADKAEAAAVINELNDIGDVDVPSPSNDQVLTFNSSTGRWEAGAGGGVGEANTASNLGGGEGIFSQKTGVDLQFKSLLSEHHITLTSSPNSITMTGPTGIISGDLLDGGNRVTGIETIDGGDRTLIVDILYFDGRARV
jgi:hypothetical protein